MNTLDKNPAGFPENLPVISEAPAGFQWQFEGEKFTNGSNPCTYATLWKDRSQNDAWEIAKSGFPRGSDNLYYARLVPAKPAVRRFKSKYYAAWSYVEFDGERCSYKNSDGSLFKGSYYSAPPYNEKEVNSMLRSEDWIELPAETEPDYFSDDAQLAVRKAWAENPDILRDWWDNADGAWGHVTHRSYFSDVIYRLRPAPPAPPEPKRVPLANRGIVVEKTESGVQFVSELDFKTPWGLGNLSYAEIEIINRLVSEPKGGAL